MKKIANVVGIFLFFVFLRKMIYRLSSQLWVKQTVGYYRFLMFKYWGNLLWYFLQLVVIEHFLKLWYQPLTKLLRSFHQQYLVHDIDHLGLVVCSLIIISGLS